jgi:peptidyl-tRNA hydrolase, PTH1 family
LGQEQDHGLAKGNNIGHGNAAQHYHSAVLGFLRRLFNFGQPPTDPLAEVQPARARLIVGLGNPGPEFASTRHNLGFLAVEELAKRCQACWVDDRRRSHTLLARGQTGDLTVIVAKPQTYMNRSGDAVRALIDQSRIDLRNVLIVYDDMDLPFGALRLRERGSPGTHNGIRSVVAALESQNVPRLRIGISQAAPGSATDHVLSEFAPEQEADVQALVSRAADAAYAWATESAVAAMNRYNAVQT